MPFQWHIALPIADAASHIYSGGFREQHIECSIADPFSTVNATPPLSLHIAKEMRGITVPRPFDIPCTPRRIIWRVVLTRGIQGASNNGYRLLAPHITGLVTGLRSASKLQIASIIGIDTLS